MEQNNKIKHFQFTMLVTLFTIGTSILLVPAVVATYAKQDAWLVTIFGLILALPIIFMYNKISNSLQDKDFFAYINKALGKKIGKIVIFIFLIYHLLLCALLIRQVAYFTITQSYPDTPFVVTTGLFMMIIVIGCRYGIETLVRTGEILFPWVFFLLAILLVTLLPELKIDNLFPMIEYGVKPLLLAYYTHSALPYLELFSFLIIIPYLHHPEKSGKSFYTGVIIGGLVLIIITLYAILVLGGEATARNTFPSYAMAKSISIANIIERIEAFLGAIWFITIYVKTAITFYCTILCIVHFFNLKTTKFLTYPLGLMLIYLTYYISPNITHFSTFVHKVWPLYCMTNGFLLPFLLILITTVKNRKNRRREQYE